MAFGMALLFVLTSCGDNDPTKDPEFEEMVDRGTVVSDQPKEIEDLVFEPWLEKPGIGMQFTNDYEMLVTWKKIWYRPIGSQDSMKATRLPFDNLHQVIWNPNDSLYYATDAHVPALITFKSLEDAAFHQEIEVIAGDSMKAPHDLLVDPETGWVYLLEAIGCRIYRFKDNPEEAELIYNKFYNKSYGRSLSMVDGQLYATNSTSAAVLQFDLDSMQGIEHHGPQVKGGMTGSWEQNGLIPIDIERYNDWWYLSNFYTRTTEGITGNVQQNRLIRFRNWEDFKAGEWQDVTPGMDTCVLAYNFTVHNDALYIGTFSGDTKWWTTFVYKVSTLDSIQE